VLLDSFEQLPFDFQVFGDHLNDPIGFGTPGEIVVKIADRDEPRSLWSEECRGAGFFCGLQAGTRDAIAHLGRFEREFARGLLCTQFPRANVQQIAQHAGVGQMRGNACAHGSRAQYGNSLRMWNSVFHAVLLESGRGHDSSCGHACAGTHVPEEWVSGPARE
jgi:hypothetical protein